MSVGSTLALEKIKKISLGPFVSRALMQLCSLVYYYSVSQATSTGGAPSSSEAFLFKSREFLVFVSAFA